MGRPKCKRCCRRYSANRVYKPQGFPLTALDRTVLDLDQFEALRLCDFERLEQEEAGRRMGVSRGTVQRLLYIARKRIVEAVLYNRALIINLKGKEAGHAGLHTHSGNRRAGR